jgi:hypothetical protein
MSWYVVAILFAVLIAIIILLVLIAQRQKRKHMNQLLNRFSKLVSGYDLHISSQAILKTCLVALDGVNRKLIVQQNSNGRHQVVDLDEVSSCSVKKQYGSIYSGVLKHHQLDQYLEKISLCFDFKTGNEPVEIPFYLHGTDAVSEVAELEHKAKDLEAVLTKMLSNPLKRIA